MSNPQGINQYSGRKIGSPMTRQTIARTIRKTRNAIRSSGMVPQRRLNREAVAMAGRLLSSKK